MIITMTGVLTMHDFVGSKHLCISLINHNKMHKMYGFAVFGMPPDQIDMRVISEWEQ